MSVAKAAAAKPPITMFGPDFPFAYDNWVKHAMAVRYDCRR